MPIPPILQIGDILISSDILTEQFCCDLAVCKGQCCVEGDAGAPVTLDEVSATAQAEIDKQGVAYTDQEGDLVTSIVGGKDCVFTYYDDLGDVKDCCLCALEKAYRQGKTSFCKPISCALQWPRGGSWASPSTSFLKDRWCAASVRIGTTSCATWPRS